MTARQRLLSEAEKKAERPSKVFSPTQGKGNSAHH